MRGRGRRSSQSSTLPDSHCYLLLMEQPHDMEDSPHAAYLASLPDHVPGDVRTLSVGAARAPSGPMEHLVAQAGNRDSWREVVETLLPKEELDGEKRK